jgi:hypothetical protein
VSGLKVESYFVGRGSLTLNCAQQNEHGRTERTAVYLDLDSMPDRIALVKQLRDAANEVERKAGN